ncbi:hypothetical protein AHF37_05140 [Paragonimus kellicotti]|nr:hypothetical protein AHF37_05140 [Paragonimus kellicotti]
MLEILKTCHNDRAVFCITPLTLIPDAPIKRYILLMNISLTCNRMFDPKNRQQKWNIWTARILIEYKIFQRHLQDDSRP